MRYQTELLPNGLMRVHDYACQWDLLYRKENGKWIAHGGNAGLPAYEHLLKILNGIFTFSPNVIFEIPIKIRPAYNASQTATEPLACLVILWHFWAVCIQLE